MTGAEQSRLILQFTRLHMQQPELSKQQVKNVVFLHCRCTKTQCSRVVERRCHVTNAASLTARRRENNNSNNVSSFFHLSALAVKGSFFSVNELFGLIFAKAKSSA